MNPHLDRARRLETFAQRDPNNPELVRDIASSYAAAGEHTLALTWFARQRELSGESSALWNAIGFSRMALGQWSDAAEAFAAGAALEPDTGALWFNLGYAQLAAGEPQAARAALEKALELGGADEAHIRYNLALACENAEDDAAARQHLGEVIRQQPDHADARTMLAVLDLFEGKIAQAREELERLLKQHPGHRQALMARAQLALLDMDAEMALRLLNEAERARPADAESLVLRGQALLVLQRVTQAGRAFERAVQADAQALPAHLGLVWVALGRDAVAEAEAHLGRAKAIDPADADVIGAEAMLRLAQKRPGDAKAAAERALAIDDSNVPALLVQTTLAAQRDDQPAAAELCRQMFSGGGDVLGTDLQALAERAAKSPAGSRVAKKFLRRAKRLADSGRG